MKLKVCGINDEHEAKLAISYGADLLGLVADMPSGVGMISDNKIHKIASGYANHQNTVLLTSRTDADSIINHQRITNTSHIQIVDHIPETEYKKIRAELVGIMIIQVIHVEDYSSYELALRRSMFVDFLLLDSGKPYKKNKTLGGTGNIHDWDISKEIVKDSKIPVYLAGGLNHSNVFDAISCVRPFGIDVYSGLRTDQKLDKDKLALFMDEIKRAKNKIPHK